jgi:hypothetical protein
MVKPLIDSDILLHELGWSGEFKDKETGELVLLPFSSVLEILNRKMDDILEQVGATETPLLFFSSSENLCRLATMVDGTEREHVPNFRYEWATTKPYKGTRDQPKPFHFLNIAAYLMSEYDFHISTQGLEADDELGIYQSSHENTIICSRDKDLRMIPGPHFSWECGKQRELGPHTTDDFGSLYKNDKGKMIGYGSKFFYYQMLTGDAVDNIPGLMGYGPVKAFNIIDIPTTIKGLKEAVIREYKYMNMKEEYYLEQEGLLWIKREY